MAKHRLHPLLLSALVGLLAGCQTQTDANGNTRATTAPMERAAGTQAAPAAKAATTVTWSHDPALVREAKKVMSQDKKTATYLPPGLPDGEVAAATLPLANGGRMLFVSLGTAGGACGSGGCDGWIFISEKGRWRNVGGMALTGPDSPFQVAPSGGPYPNIVSQGTRTGLLVSHYDQGTGEYHR